MSSIIQTYHYSHLSSSLPPGLGRNLDILQIHRHTEFVKDESQILRGVFCIPSTCYGVSFMRSDQDRDSTTDFIESVMYVRKDRFFTRKDIFEKFGENNDI